MSGGSTVPAAKTAMVTAFTAAVPAGVAVNNGPFYRSTSSDVVAVGFNFDQPAVQMRQSPSSLSLAHQAESYDVTSVISSIRATDAGFTEQESSVFAVLDAVVASLAADQTLGAVVSSARVTDWFMVPEFTDQGATLSLVLTVHIEAWR